jgi:hypothetical protein
MGALPMFPIATNRAQSSGPCAKLILEAEMECGAFMSATNQLFGKEVACKAVGLWVEELEAGPKHLRGPGPDCRIVTISAASRLADLMGATRGTRWGCSVRVDAVAQRLGLLPRADGEAIPGHTK